MDDSEDVAVKRKKKDQRKRRGRGEGAVYQRTDGRWTASVSLGYDGNGKRQRRVIYGDTKKEAQDKLRDLQNRAGLGTLPERGRLTVRDWLTAWLVSVKATKEPNTYLQYEQHCRLHLIPILGHRQVTMLEQEHVENMYVGLTENGVSASQQRRIGTTLRAAVGREMKRKKSLIRVNPCFGVDKPKYEAPERVVWDANQALAFLAAARSDRLYAMYLLALDTGARQGELFGLQWGDFDFTAGSVSFQRSLEETKEGFRLKAPKTKSGRRRVTLSTVAIAAIHEHRKVMLAAGFYGADKAVFCDTQGGYLRKMNVLHRSFEPTIERANKAAADAAKIGQPPTLLPRISFHDLRHSSATLLLGAEENLKVVSERLGHASVKITADIYAHVTPTMQKAAAEKIGRILGGAMPKVEAAAGV